MDRKYFRKCLKESDFLEDLDVNGRISLKFILQK
jgi:hypothetical protein